MLDRANKEAVMLALSTAWAERRPGEKQFTSYHSCSLLNMNQNAATTQTAADPRGTGLFPGI